MTCKQYLYLLLVPILVISTDTASSQIDPGVMPANFFEILDVQGVRLGTVLIVEDAGRGYEAGREYWRFSETSLMEIAEQESLELAIWAQGEWDDPWVVEALRWRPSDSSVEWNHPAEVEWTTQEERLPPIVHDGTYFGNATLGGLTIKYSSRGPSSLTWFKLTEGAFMQLEDGAIFHRDSEPPATGSWWHGPIDSAR